MRPWWLVVVLGACSFRPGVAPTAAQTDAPPSIVPAPDAPAIDASVLPIDASDWPCGVKPAAPGASVVFSATSTSITISNVSLGGINQLDVVAPGTAVTLALHYDIMDTACPGNCIDQIEIGVLPGARQGCIYDAAVSKTSGAAGNASMQLTMPATPGAYDVRFHLGQNYSCTYQGATGWWGGTEPGPTLTIGKLCVH